MVPFSLSLSRKRLNHRKTWPDLIRLDPLLVFQCEWRFFSGQVRPFCVVVSGRRCGGHRPGRPRLFHRRLHRVRPTRLFRPSDGEPSFAQCFFPLDLEASSRPISSWLGTKLSSDRNEFEILLRTGTPLNVYDLSFLWNLEKVFFSHVQYLEK